MPYTPPPQRSPASSNPNSPNVSRSHSYIDSKLSSPKVTGKPGLPRSLSSTSYLQKHRRTPSISQTNGVSRSGTSSESFSTPPDSAQGSDDEERARLGGSNLDELHQALATIEQKREHSPSEDDNTNRENAEPGSGILERPALTAEARKISHSRSSSDLALSQHAPAISESPTQGSDDSEEDDGLSLKPPLLRKKSGELVKPALRPTSRRRPSSMPGTPTYSKAVHFNEDIEQVRHFLQVDRPIAVSAGSSPVEAYDSESEYPFGYNDAQSSRRVEWDIRLANFPRNTYERQSKPVRVERIFLSADCQTLIGTVAVANLAFHKAVVARFTLDYWKTVSEVAAEFNNDVRKKQSDDGYDRFNFTMRLADQANLETKTLLLCVRYNVNGREYWDNNDNMNYQVDFTKKTKPKVSNGNKKQGAGSGPSGAIPRSRQSPPAPRPRSMPISFDDDFGRAFNSNFEFGPPRAFLGDSPNNTIRLKKKPGTGAAGVGNQGRQSNGNQAFSGRYDFGASLSAALSNAQSVLGDRSGIQMKSKAQAQPANSPGEGVNPTPKGEPAATSTAPAVGDSARPDALSSGKPDLQSAEYNELIQKYCFFGSSGKGSQATSSTASTPAATGDSNQAATKAFQTDGAQDDLGSGLSSALSSRENSCSNSPVVAEDLPNLFDGASESRSPLSDHPYFSPPATPRQVKSGSAISSRATSPYRYPYSQNLHGGIFPDANAPTAIRG